jgi:RNA polymerase sigma-70 factor, ECF subfamily
MTHYHMEWVGMAHIGAGWPSGGAAFAGSLALSLPAPVPSLTAPLRSAFPPAPAPRMPHGPTAVFEGHRPILQAIAYRMLGTVEDAEGVVTETLLRWLRSDTVDLVAADWMERECLRVSLAELPEARARRSTYVGPWLPEPLVGGMVGEWGGGARLLSTLPTLNALLHLERLPPAERGALVLREGCGYSYLRMAALLERSPASCRTLVSRARRRLQDETAGRRDAGPAPADLRDRFLLAAGSGAAGRLEKVLSPGVQLWTDGGGVTAAALRVIEGAERVSRFIVELSLRARPGTAAVRSPVNREPGILILERGRVSTVITVVPLGDGRIGRVLMVRNPTKLLRADPPAGPIPALPRAGPT